MRRRTVLAALAAVALPASGCLGSPDPEVENGASPRTSGAGATTGTDRTRTSLSTSTATPTEAVTGPYAVGESAPAGDAGVVTVESMAVQTSVLQYNGTFHSRYEPDGDRQLLVVTVGSASPPEFPLYPYLDGRRVRPEYDTPPLVDGYRYALSVPVRAVSSAMVVADVGDRPAWRVPAEQRERLGAIPDFRILGAEVEATDPPSLSVTVANRGGRDGVFRGLVDVEGASDVARPFRIPVGRGETVTESVANATTGMWAPDGSLTHPVTDDTRRFEAEYDG